ncbi:hypothetical protein F5J12DRAFT_782077 [Pisolithus orientalis]|uniref:uncharacterized protein n=1 Tax=Pisolithus orientalis TaxID=936130 RepID=UPI0022244F67|nr:uncharacterized protein F5J12DRAFT_782077 [Pisolithus orientalis]KAI6009573.1 hypothetical protein F5J12DRAFT_782077 [Pisolithus orientalis]
MAQDRLTVPPSIGDRSTSLSPLLSETPVDPAAVVEIALEVQLERRRRWKLVTFRPSGYESRHYQKLLAFWNCRAPCTSRPSEKFVPVVNDDSNEEVVLSSLSLGGSAAKAIAARHSILAALPLPSNILIVELQPIVLLHPYLLGDSFRNTMDVHPIFLSNPFSNQNLQTRELPRLDTSHDVLVPRSGNGYFLTPVLKCATNLRVVNAHRWSPVDVLGHIREATECSYHKDGKWYYACTYKAFRMDDLTTQEVGFALDRGTGYNSRAVIKETFAGREDVPPQNTHETGQVYATGTLRVSCVGLQYIGFNDAVLEQSRFVH